MNPREYLKDIRQLFAAHGDPLTAEGQMAYMRHQFSFYGLKAPVWTALFREFVREHGYPAYGGDLEEVVRRAYEEEHRELHYVALQIIEKTQKNSGADLIQLLEELILTHSWWDTVDWIAKLVGIHFQRFPDQIAPVTERWMASDSFWLQRVAIIYQLRYKDRTDTDRLFRYILQVARSREFFLQKAAGWALRQHAKTDPALVAAFVSRETLPALTVREARKQLEKEGY